MRFPIVICSHRTLIAAAADFFEGIGKLDISAGILEVNVTHDGTAGFEWILDSEAIFFELTSERILPLNLLQRIGLKRPRERFSIAPGRQISAGEIASRISNLHNQFEEAQNVSDFKDQLAPLASEYILRKEDMLKYFSSNN
jgi:hypothetical protein